MMSASTNPRASIESIAKTVAKLKNLPETGLTNFTTRLDAMLEQRAKLLEATANLEREYRNLASTFMNEVRRLWTPDEVAEALK